MEYKENDIVCVKSDYYTNEWSPAIVVKANRFDEPEVKVHKFGWNGYSTRIYDTRQIFPISKVMNKLVYYTKGGKDIIALLVGVNNEHFHLNDPLTNTSLTPSNTISLLAPFPCETVKNTKCEVWDNGVWYKGSITNHIQGYPIVTYSKNDKETCTKLVGTTSHIHIFEPTIVFAMGKTS